MTTESESRKKAPQQVDKGDPARQRQVAKRANGQESGGSSIPWLAIAVGVAALALAGIATWYFFFRGDEEKSAQQGPPPAVVAAARAEQQTWRTRLTAIGTLQAVEGIEVTSEVAGKVVKIAFEAGQEVREGELLVELDTDNERAALRSLQARLQKAKTDEARARRLIKRGAIAQSEVEAAATETDSLQAQVEQQRTLITKKTIAARFDGKLGIRRISPGQLISPGTPIVTLQSIAPIFVNFTLPERAFSQVKPDQAVDVIVPAYPERTFTGKVTAIDPKISEMTRSFSVQALLPNEDRLLNPGMFADVTVDLGAKRTVVAIPATAVTFNAYGESVFFVREPQQGGTGAGAKDAQERGGGGPQPPQDAPPGSNVNADAESQARGKTGAQPRGPVMRAKRAFVETGERRGLMIEVTKGVQAGDRLVTAGQLKIDNNFPIIVSEEKDALESVRSRPLRP